MTKLNPEFKAQLCAELRSGKYVQGQGLLRSNGKWCCLGVAANIIDPNGFVKDEGSKNFTYRWHESSVTLHDGQEVVDLGLTTNVQRTLWKLNDDGASFHQIADYIETHF